MIRFLLGLLMPWRRKKKKAALPKKVIAAQELYERFPVVQPDIYYSLYTADDEKRAQFMPQAADVLDGLQYLLRWQKYSKKIPKIHFSIVPGLNDEPRNIELLAWTIKRVPIRVDFNLIDFNPPGGEVVGQRPVTLDFVQRELEREFPDSRVKIIPRISPDIYASCGMFYK
jgi:adenine C2-methylase RlmN of 23S rRNA A2503 and tRNA A37